MRTSIQTIHLPVTLDVLLFGAAAAAAGADRVPVVMGMKQEVVTAQEVLASLGSQHPSLRTATTGARLAVNQAFAKPDAPVRAGDELALIALVGGG